MLGRGTRPTLGKRHHTLQPQRGLHRETSQNGLKLTPFGSVNGNAILQYHEPTSFWFLVIFSGIEVFANGSIGWLGNISSPGRGCWIGSRWLSAGARHHRLPIRRPLRGLKAPTGNSEQALFHWFFDRTRRQLH